MVRYEPKLHNRPKIQVDNDRLRRSCLSIAAAPPLRAGLPTNMHSAGSATRTPIALNVVENSWHPQRFDIDSRHGFSTNSTCIIAASTRFRITIHSRQIYGCSEPMELEGKLK